MRKVLTLLFLVLTLVVSACSNTTSSTAPTVSNTPSETNEGEAAEEKPKTDYPNRPIEILVPFDAGGSTDTSARLVAKYLPKYLPNNVNIVINNKPGGGGTIAATELFNAEPDGYTLELSTHRAIAMQPLYGQTVYQHDSFQPIAKVTTDQQVFVVNAESPWQNFEEWLEYVKENPGVFTFAASGGIGSGAHLPMAELEFIEDFTIKAIAFDGTAPAMTAVLGGHIDGAIGQPSSVKALIESGEFRMILNAGSTPVPYAPEIPTLIDLGYDTSYDSNASLIAPKGLPEEVLEILVDALKNTLADPELQKEFENADIQLDYKGPEQVQEEFDRENSKSKEILTRLDLL